MSEDLPYPVGKFFGSTESRPKPQRQTLIGGIAEVSANRRAAVVKRSEAQLDLAYRPDGWTICPHLAHNSLCQP